VAEAEAEAFVRERTEYLQSANRLVEIDENSKGCHKCGRPHEERYFFGLAEMLIDKRNWWETAASVAVSALTLPTIGIGTLRFPGRKRQARILKFHLLLCCDCASGYKTIFGALREDGYAAHPCWEPAHNLGFTKFLSAEEVNKFNPPDTLGNC
jgi:hypothetical protein